jgi:hypothetical protein
VVPKEVRELFKKFYCYLIDLFENAEFYNNPSQNIVMHYRFTYKFDKKLEYKTLDELIVNLEYYIFKKVRSDRIINETRTTITWHEISDTLDETKTYRALRANLIHALDATLARRVLLAYKYPIITIHDSFGIDILNQELIVLVALDELKNLKVYNERLFLFKRNTAFEIHSPFVLL